MKTLRCITDKDCVKNHIYGNKYNGCVNTYCYDYKKFSKKI